MRKTKKPNAKQRQLMADWETLLKKTEVKKTMGRITHEPWKPVKRYTRQTQFIPSLPFEPGVCSLKPPKVYTGTAMKGIGTMHKSNSIPIFTNEQAVEIATMRRG